MNQSSTVYFNLTVTLGDNGPSISVSGPIVMPLLPPNQYVDHGVPAQTLINQRRQAEYREEQERRDRQDDEMRAEVAIAAENWRRRQERREVAHSWKKEGF